MTSITIPNSVTSVYRYAFENCNSLKNVYYTGSKEEWKSIEFCEKNDCLLNATLHYNRLPTAAVVPGDLDGDGKVNVKDNMLLARYLAGWRGYDKTTVILEAADLNGDGTVNVKDNMILARHLAGWVGYETLPVSD